MSKLKSNFAPMIDAMIEYHVALGFTASSLKIHLGRFDHYCAEHYPDSDTLTKELVFAWLYSRAENPPNDVSADARVVRQFAEYLKAIRQDAYVLPSGFYPLKRAFTPYIFTDDELTLLFRAADSLPYKRNLDRGDYCTRAIPLDLYLWLASE